MHHHLGQQQRERGDGGERNGHGGLVGGAILVALGVAFLAQNTFNVTGLGFRWPFFIIGPGLLLFAAMIAGGRGAGGLAVPASIVTTIGLILLFQDTFDYYESWAYIWALIPAAGGVGTAIAGAWEGNDKLLRDGKRAALGGLTMLLIFGGFFELLIFHNGALLANAWTVALIVGGGFLMVNALRERRAERERPYSPLDDDDQTADPDRVFPY